MLLWCLTLCTSSSTRTGTHRTSLSNFSSVLLPGQALHFPYRLSCLQPPPQKDISNNTPHSLVNATSFQQLFCASDPRFSFSFSRTSSNQPQTDSFFSYSSFQFTSFQSYKHPLELLYPQMTLFNKSALEQQQQKACFPNECICVLFSQT